MLRKLFSILLIILVMVSGSACVEIGTPVPSPEPSVDNKDDVPEEPTQVPQGWLPAGEYLFGYPDEEEALKGNYVDTKADDYYNYAPSMRQIDEYHRYVYYCSNIYAGEIVDCTAFREGIKVGGIWYYSPKRIVTTPLPNTWENEHNCDPNVIKGEFAYNNVKYKYLMTYLGCITLDCQINEIGLAVSQSPEGPWTKCADVNPFISYTYDPQRTHDFQWGYGQSSAVSVDKKGRILLAYTDSPGNRVFVTLDRWDLSNLNKPIREFSVELTINGIPMLNGLQAPTITNPDIAYDPVNKRIYMVCDALPLDRSNTPDFITQALYVGYFQENDSGEIGDTIKSPGRKTWTHIGFIDKKKTGYARNHNGGIITDEYGHLYSDKKLDVAYSVCYEINRGPLDILCYRIRETSFNI